MDHVLWHLPFASRKPMQCARGSFRPCLRRTGPICKKQSQVSTRRNEHGISVQLDEKRDRLLGTLLQRLLLMLDEPGGIVPATHEAVAV